MNDPAAFAELLARLGGGLTLLARQYTSAPEDAVQEAFVRLAALRTLPDSPEAWLFRAVRNRALDLRKSEARRRRREARPGPWFVEAAVDGLDADVAVAALGRLPEDQRDVVIARLWNGLTLAQIAGALGSSVSTAHRRYEAAIAELRHQLGGSADD